MVNVLNNLREQALLLKNAYRRDGFRYVIAAGSKYVARWPLDAVTTIYYRYLHGGRSFFTFQGRSYHYFYHSYNTTWNNPRIVEVPLIWKLVQENRGKRILEIGNVLRHYFPYPHDVVDLYEKYLDVINQDIIAFHPANKYDLVVSISTFEHIGYNENESNNPEKLLKAINNVVNDVLAPGGRFVFTVPLGENTAMEEFLASGIIEFTALNCLRRIAAKGNHWREISWNDILTSEFNIQGHWGGSALTIVIGTIIKPSE